MTSTLIDIDGAFGEGGGQIIRTSLSLSAITQKPFAIKNIRLNRKPKPHMRPQHLMAALAVAQMTQGELVNAKIGSQAFTYYPGAIRPGEYVFDIDTAGSAILVAQTIIPILLHANSSSFVRIIGGTHLPKSPSYDYFQHVFLKAIKQFQAKVRCKLIKSGYYPAGGGTIEIEIEPAKLVGCTHWNKFAEPQAIIRLANLPLHIAEREKDILEKNHIKHIKIYEEHTLSPGNTVTIWQGFKGSTALGVRGLPAENVALNALDDFTLETADVDLHLADQLLLYAALAKKPTAYQTSMLSPHLLTNAYVIAHFIDRKVEFIENKVIIKEELSQLC